MAVTCLALPIWTKQGPVWLEQAPDQPVNLAPCWGVAVRVTRELAANSAEQAVPQLMPEGEEVTVPWALSGEDLKTVRRLGVGGGRQGAEEELYWPLRNG